MSLQEELSRLLRERGAEVLSSGPQRIRMRMSGGGAEADLSLSNLRAKLGREPGAKEALLGSFADAAVRSLSVTEGGVLLPRILPWKQDSSLSSPWHRPLVDGELRLSLCLDLGDRLRHLQPMDIHRLGIPLEEAVSRAKDGLRRVSAGVKPAREGDGALVFESGDGFDASRLLILSDWLEGEALVAVPSRDALWVLPGRRDTDFLRWKVVQAHAALPYPLSPGLFRWKAGVLSAL